MLQAQFPELECMLASAVAACLLQARRLGRAPLPLKQAAPAMHPGLEAALVGDPWNGRCAEPHTAQIDRQFKCRVCLHVSAT